MMEDAFYEKYSNIINDKVCMPTNNECVMWTAGTSGEKVKYGVKVKFKCGKRNFTAQIDLHAISKTNIHESKPRCISFMSQ